MDPLYLQTGLTLGLVTLFFIIRSVISRIIRRHGGKYEIETRRISYVQKMLNSLIAVIILTGIGLVWDVSFQGLTLYFASFFTVAGIGLFAQWSILSNITASIILFFYFPYKIGNRVKIVDGENSIIGTVKDITVFVIKIETDDKSEVNYPNNLAIQKPIISLSQ